MINHNTLDLKNLKGKAKTPKMKNHPSSKTIKFHLLVLLYITNKFIYFSSFPNKNAEEIENEVNAQINKLFHTSFKDKFQQLRHENELLK